MRRFLHHYRTVTVSACTLAAGVGAAGFTAGCYEAVHPLGDRLLVLQVIDTATADGASLTEVLASVRGELLPGEREVKLTTTAGAFTATDAASVTLPLDESATAVALLRAPAEPTVAVVTMTATDRTKTGRVTFSPAGAERIEVVPASFVVEAGSDAEITAWLRRSVGKVSQGAEVRFSAVDSTGAVWAGGRFAPGIAVSDAQGKAMTRLMITDSLARGKVLIRAVTQRGGAVGDAHVDVVAP